MFLFSKTDDVINKNAAYLKVVLCQAIFYEPLISRWGVGKTKGHPVKF